MVLQITPLPAALVAAVSPNAAALHDTIALRPGGAWRTISVHPEATRQALALAAAAAYVLARQAVARPQAAFEWPAELETAHQPALVAMALLAVVAALDGRRAPSPD
jgi:hypothetical protein